MQLNFLRPDDVTVEMMTAIDDDGNLSHVKTAEMHRADQLPDGRFHYTGTAIAHAGGSLVVGVRVLPTNPGLITKHELGLMRWA